MANRTGSRKIFISSTRAPLRNRTVDLLLTMNGRTVPLPLVQGVTRQNTSTGQHPHATDRPSRAPFATQSATQFDLPRVSAGGRERADAVEHVTEAVFFYLHVVAGLQVDPEPLRRAEETGPAHRIV